MRCRVAVVVCVCVCVYVSPVRFFQTVTNRPEKTYRLPQRCNCLTYVYITYCSGLNWVKTCFCETASSRRYRIRVAAVLEHRLAILLALAGARAYIHSRDVALYHMVFLYGLCYCVWRDAIYRTCVSSSLDVDLDYVQSFA